jgi:rRNA biogenesis protein RRP5
MSQLSDNKDADTTLALRSVQEGDIVKAFVTSVDLEKRRISFSLKPSHFADEDFQQADDASSEEDQEPLGVVEDVEMASAGEDGVDDMDRDAISEDDQDQDSEIEPMAVGIGADIQSLNPKQVDAMVIPSAVRPAAVLKIQGGFQWSGDIPQEGADDAGPSEDSDSDEQASKKRRKKKKKQIELDLTADMHNKTPESTSDFERVLLGSPNSSYLWIQYMSFQLQLSELEKAREVAKRALNTINFREEKEKLNVWIALMNLENVYGSDESLESVFKDAARHCEPKTVHLRLASILEESGKNGVIIISPPSIPYFFKKTFCSSRAVLVGTESGRAVQADLQKVWAKLQSLVLVLRTLPKAGRRGTSPEAPPKKSAEFREAQT